MENHWLSVVSFGTLAGAATFAGMSLVLIQTGWSRRHSAKLVSYSAGVLLGVGILHILPEAWAQNPHTPYYLLISFLVFYFLEHHLFVHAEHEKLHHAQLEAAGHNQCCLRPHPLGIVAFAGMSLHSLIDGLIIGTGFEAGHDIGILSAVGVIAHEVPEGIAMLAILLHYGYPRRTAVIFTCLVAVATPLAAIGTYALVRQIGAEFLGALMALAAGSFIYIAASDLIPESHRSRGFMSTLSLLAGILTAVLAGWLAHSHLGH